MPAPPTRIADRYDVIRPVGRGGMGTVWLCRDDRLGREVAVKQVGLLPGESTTQLSRALREARSSAALNNPHVVTVFDAVEEGDHAWLVMEHVPSRTLAEVVAADGALPPERVAWIGAQAAAGLAAAHAGGIVHRDVKPSNVLVTDDDTVKITDFGIARTHGQEALTRTGIVMGTPGYFAPELARGEEPQPGSDVWALGATLFAAVEGAPPYTEQGNALALLARIANEPPPTPVRAGFLTEPIARMMDPDPASRWSMVDTERVLRRLHAQHPAGAAGPDAADRTIALALPVTPSEPAETPVPTPAPLLAPAPTPDVRRPRRRRALLGLAVVLLLAAVAGGVALVSRDDDPDTARDTPGAQSPSRAGASTRADQPVDPQTSAPSAPAATTEPVDPAEPSEESEPEESATEEQPAPPATDAGAFAGDYYSYLPDDTDSAYALLSEDYRARTSSTEYAGFWRTIEAVEVRGTNVVDDTTVDVDLTYTTSAGTEDETRRLYLEETDDGWAITDDEVV